jgi:peroxiredoxin
MARNFRPDAPPLQIAQWLNTDTPLTLASMRGRVVVIEAFQMLCPACVTHSLPQARKVRQLFPTKDVAVIGLHTVFEHHDVMGPAALEAFVREYRLSFPIGIDAPFGSSIPATMREYQMQGTPTTVLVDRHGRLRMSHFGVLDDIALGAAIGQLLAEDTTARQEVQAPNETAAALEAGVACDALGCGLA